MKKTVFIFSFCLLTVMQLNAQTTTFDNLNANPLTNKAITWTSSNYGSGFGHRIINSDPGGQTLLNFQARNNTTIWSDIMTLTSNGKIGIGTSTPSEKLQIENGIVKVRNNNNANRFIWSRTDNTMSAGLAGDGGRKMFLLADNLTRMTIDGNNGNIGIGTTTPSEKFEVYGNGASIKLNASNASSLYSLKFTSNYNYSNKFTIKSGDAVIMQEKSIIDIGGTGNTNSKMFLSNYYGLGFSTTSNPESKEDIDLYITGNSNSVQKGNIGIGTTTPDAKLTVKGNIHSNEVKVDLLGAVAPDYVFYKDYDLKTLKEVETYIAKKGHLPNIPSAKEMETNGLYLKDMNLKLLGKIEELTLYTIQQEKEITTLKKKSSKVDKLEKELQNQKDRLQKIESLLNSIKQ